jgi:hypothetical protein
MVDGDLGLCLSDVASSRTTCGWELDDEDHGET